MSAKQKEVIELLKSGWTIYCSPSMVFTKGGCYISSWQWTVSDQKATKRIHSRTIDALMRNKVISVDQPYILIQP